MFSASSFAASFEMALSFLVLLVSPWRISLHILRSSADKDVLTFRVAGRAFLGSATTTFGSGIVALILVSGRGTLSVNGSAFAGAAPQGGGEHTLQGW